MTFYKMNWFEKVHKRAANVASLSYLFAKFRKDCS